MSTKIAIKIFAFIELLIGLSTFISLIACAALSISKKPLNVFIFVIASATISAILGVGIINYKERARVILVFFSGYIVLTKILVIAGLLQLCCDIITFIPVHLKNGTSIIYHLFIALFFTRQNVKRHFVK